MIENINVHSNKYEKPAAVALYLINTILLVFCLRRKNCNEDEQYTQKHLLLLAMLIKLLLFDYIQKTSSYYYTLKSLIAINHFSQIPFFRKRTVHHNTTH